LIELLRRAREEGGRHIAIMAHIGHARELGTKKVEDAINRIQKESFATIRSQSPIMRGINDDADVWAEKWRKEVNMGIIPYYMFMARDTGAQQYFEVPLVKAQKLYSDAIRKSSGLIRTARGPSMSCTPGKVEVLELKRLWATRHLSFAFCSAATKTGLDALSLPSLTRMPFGLMTWNPCRAWSFHGTSMVFRDQLLLP
jgi:L-lysine 2,3-aminomutase